MYMCEIDCLCVCEECSLCRKREGVAVLVGDFVKREIVLPYFRTRREKKTFRQQTIV